jgi:hypothetical protein
MRGYNCTQINICTWIVAYIVRNGVKYKNKAKNKIIIKKQLNKNELPFTILINKDALSQKPVKGGMPINEHKQQAVQ